VIGRAGVNLRAQPINGSVIARLNFNQEVTIRGAQPQGGTSSYKWIEVDSPAGRGFVRDDYLSIRGDASAFGLSKGDEYPAPMKNYWWVRGFNVNQNPGEPEHLGWDFGAQIGEPVLAGPNGGTVILVSICSKCTPERPSSLMHGFGLGDTSVFNDEGWGFGYGTYVIVRYDSHLLPPSSRERLAQRGLGGAHLFALYGHLQTASVTTGQTVTGAQQIGTCGNTGNSQAPHLHLEIRAGSTLTPQWWQIRNGLLDPSILFLR
jgi:murein DD-endopeptidase MepM/ murein hydrolase activator NlpD